MSDIETVNSDPPLVPETQQYVDILTEKPKEENFNKDAPTTGNSVKDTPTTESSV